ncbi:MAG TPA: 4-hydroxy-tetrahydrodipicolinate reductase [bacterium]|nr:4-hydroxy-tetrahydrodipicolinate reductase [bacterium]
MTKIVVSGACGKMGKMIVESVLTSEGAALAGLLEQEGHDTLGKEVCGCRVDSEPGVISKCDVLIEFSTPQASLEHLAAARRFGKAVVLGTTGFSDTEKKKIEEASKVVPLVFSPNMSLGVNLLYSLIKRAAQVLEGYDTEIVEAHHRMKADAPSGTALAILKAVQEVKGGKAVFGREGKPGPRKSSEIGVMAMRAGDIVGEHTVIFAGPGERIELIHRAHSRETFARGAVRAALWLAGRKPGLYGMQDVLGIEG